MIGYDLAASGKTTLKSCNVLGEEIKTNIDGYQQPCNHRIVFDAQSACGGLSSGVYVYTLTVGEKVTSGKMISSK